MAKLGMGANADEWFRALESANRNVVNDFNNTELLVADHFRGQVADDLPHPMSKGNSPLFKGLRLERKPNQINVKSEAKESHYRLARRLAPLPPQFSDWDYAPRVDRYGTKYFKPIPIGGGRYKLWADPEHPRLAKGYFTDNVKKLNRSYKSGRGKIWRIIASQLAQKFAKPSQAH